MRLCYNICIISNRTICVVLYVNFELVCRIYDVMRFCYNICTVLWPVKLFFWDFVIVAPSNHNFMVPPLATGEEGQDVRLLLHRVSWRRGWSVDGRGAAGLREATDGGEPVLDVPQEGGADGVPVPVRGHLLRRAPLLGQAPLRLRLQDRRPGEDRQAEPRRGRRQDRQDLKPTRSPESIKKHRSNSRSWSSS